MSRYSAPKPQKTRFQQVYPIVSRILFPPLLVWDVFRYGFNWLFGKAVGGVVLQAQGMNFAGGNTELTAFAQTCSVATFSEFTLTTHDGAVLSGHEIRPPGDKPKKYIINFAGNAMSYMQVPREFLADARALNACVIGFDYRGVNQSTGRARSSKDLVIDGIAQVRRLLDDGVKASDITLKGLSLGGGVSALVAAHFHRLGHKVNVFNDRSFSSLSNVVVGHIRGAGERIERPLLGKVFGFLLKPILKLALWLTQWEVAAAKAFKSVPAQYREYRVVRDTKSHENKVISDPIITHYGSMHAALDGERSNGKAKIDAALTHCQQALDKASAPLQRQDLAAQREHLERARAQFAARKMDNCSTECDNGHIVAPSDLQNRFDEDGPAFFRRFVSTSPEARLASLEIPVMHG